MAIVAIRIDFGTRMAARFVEQGRDAAAMQLQGDEWPSTRDDADASGTNGAVSGTTGAVLKVPLPAYASVALFIVVLLTVNVLTVQHDAGPSLPGWKPLVAEYTAALMILLTMPAVAFLTVRTPVRRGRWAAAVLAHSLGAIAFCTVVVGGFVILRKAIYGFIGLHYVFVPTREVVYEFRKVALAYVGMVFVFHLTSRSRGATSGSVQVHPQREAAMFDIRDGAKVMRVAVDEILSMRAAGNYVEFNLHDGRRPLMRATLASLEGEFRPHGFVRTHRSWIINVRRLRALEPGGSGDWRIRLEDGTEAPLSRRYPDALAAVRRI